MELPVFAPAPSCTACGLHEGARRPGIPTVHLDTSLLSPSAPLLVCIGMNPGQKEDEVGIPFIGPSGQDLRRKYLQATRLDTLACIYITNAVRCWTPLLEQPKAKHQNTCMPLFTVPDLATLGRRHASAPRHLLLLGGDACSAAARLLFDPPLPTGSRKLAHFLRHQGTPTTHPSFPPFQCWATYHPSYLLRTGGAEAPTVAAHLALLHNVLSGRPPVPSRPTILPLQGPPCPPTN